jgi:putative SOS response-associated peptidase YedK
MCFNISLKVKKARMEERFNAVYPVDSEYKTIYHTSAFEKPYVPILTSQSPYGFQLMQWGLIPNWVKTDKEAKEISLLTLNARAESIAQKPSFKQSSKSNRCLVPVTGFFEWQQVNSKKIPWFITLKDEDLFSLAGLWSEWVNPQTGELTNTFTIITTEANDLMAKIHNTKKRMPAILSIKDEIKWLDPNLEANQFSSILKPFDDKLLNAYTVSPLVSQANKNRNIPEVLDQYSYEIPKQGNLF